MSDHGNSRVLVSNDDGIKADGIAALAKIAEHFFDEVWVVAPDRETSMIGHRVTTYQPLRYHQLGERKFSVEGTPADCIRVGLHLMGPTQRPDWIWSGINHGGNLGLHDYFVSGTMAAAREAAFLGYPAMGTSHFMKSGLPLDWEQAAERIGQAFEQVKQKADAATSEFWCVNLPHLTADEAEPEMVFCHPEAQPLEVAFETVPDTENSLQYSGDYHNRPRKDGSDVAHCFGGNIAITRFQLGD